MDKIISLNSEPFEGRDEPPTEIIEHLERVLKAARTGDVVACAISYVTRGGWGHFEIAAVDHHMILLGNTELMKLSLAKNWEATS